MDLFLCQNNTGVEKGVESRLKNHADALIFQSGNLSQGLKYALIAVGNLRFPTRVIAVNCSDMEDLCEK